MDHCKQFEKYAGEKFRAIALIITHEDGTEEWSAVVDAGEFPAKERTINGHTEIIRPLKRTHKTYRIFLKDGEIIKHMIFKPEYKFNKNAKPNYSKK